MKKVSEICPANSEMKSDGSLVETILELVQFFKDSDKQGLIPRKSSEKSVEFRTRGNDVYRQNKHTEAHYRNVLSFYTKSLAYAPSESEEFALALSNRSVLWLHLHRYDLCLVDIDKALVVTKSPELTDKLQARRVRCSDLYTSYFVAQDDCKEPMINRLYSTPKLCKFVDDKKLEVPRFVDVMGPDLPKFTPNKLIPCAADSITLQCNEKYGRHYTATRDIRPGEFLMSEESSYVSVELDQTYLICSHCLAFAWSVIPCELCAFAIYCSEKCKKEALSQYHEVQCSILPFLNSGIHAAKDISSVNELIRMMIILLKSEGLEAILKEAKHMREQSSNVLSNDATNCGKFKSIYSLMSFKEDVKDIDAIAVTVLSLLYMSKYIWRDQFHYKQDEIESETMFSLKIIVKKLYLISQLNSFKFQVAPCVCDDHTMCRVKKDEVIHRGSILGNHSSFFNHSCDPNVNKIFLPGPRIVFFTIRPIRKGEQLFIAYVNHELGKESRQNLLRKKYLLSCDCNRCKENWSQAFEIFSNPLPMAKCRLLSQQSKKIFGKHEGNFMRLPKDWYYDEDLYKRAVKMNEFLHKEFPEHEAHNTSQVFRLYIHRYYFYVYGERVDLF